MGADWVGAVVPVTRSRDRAFELLESMPFAEIRRRTQWLIDSDELDEEELLARCREAIEITYEASEGKLRAASFARFGDVTFAVAGGLSWGDEPDFVNDLGIVLDLGVTYDEGEWVGWGSI